MVNRPNHPANDPARMKQWAENIKAGQRRAKALREAMIKADPEKPKREYKHKSLVELEKKELIRNAFQKYTISTARLQSEMLKCEEALVTELTSILGGE